MNVEEYYSFPPMNRSAVTSSAEEHENFFWALSEALDCTVISSPESYIYDAALFYDSNFHLNDAGVPVRTMQLAEDILRTAGYNDFLEIPVPEISMDTIVVLPAPETDPSAAVDTSFTETDASFFTTEAFAGGVMITGVTGEGESLEEIVLPAAIDGKTVLAIGENAFSDRPKLRQIVIGTSVVQLYDGIFRGCGSLERIVLRASSASAVAVGEELLDGADKAEIYVSKEAYVSFVSDYFWSHYVSVLRVQEA